MENKKFRNEIIYDIEVLQLAKNTEIFDRASELFIQKWKDISGTFIKYFKHEWIQKNPNWYEGEYSNLPNTNNALESFNRKIKDEYTLRERLPLGRFIIHPIQHINQWSQDYLKELDWKIFSEEPHLTLELWIKVKNK